MQTLDQRPAPEGIYGASIDKKNSFRIRNKKLILFLASLK
jgi:hypothetical protein